MFRVIIAGTRTFADYELLKGKMDAILSRKVDAGEDVVIVSGTARGADQLGERYARERGYKIHAYPANWDAYGKAAGYKRNVQMAEHAEACVVFWDGISRGSEHMCNIAKEHGLQLRIIRY